MAGEGGHELPGAVLFVCTMNSVRSPMAAAILRHLAGRRLYVESAGVRAGGSDAFAVAAMPSENGQHYYLEIMLPGFVVGAIIGFLTQKMGTSSPVKRSS